jgi:hypothetical protein
MDWYVLPFVAVCFIKLGFDAAIHWSIVCAAFCWGLNVSSNTIKRTIQAIAIGVGISGAIAICQTAFGFHGIYQIAIPGGLFLNKNLMGEAACLAFIAAVTHRLWLSALITTLPLVLSGCRAAYLGAFVGVLFWLAWPLRAVLLAAGAAVVFAAYATGHGLDLPSLAQRIYMWQDAAASLRWFGDGSYELLFPTFREPHLHNDWLQLVYELGIAGLIPLAAVLAAATRQQAALFVAALFIIACFGFPLQMPATAWFAAFVIGHHLRNVPVERGTLLRARLA